MLEILEILSKITPQRTLSITVTIACTTEGIVATKFLFLNFILMQDLE